MQFYGFVRQVVLVCCLLLLPIYLLAFSLVAQAQRPGPPQRLVSTPSLPSLRNNPLLARDVVVSGDYAYVAAGEAGLLVLDVSYPTSPNVAGIYLVSGSTESVTVSANYAYVAAGEAGLRIVDISNPANPTEVGSFNTPGGATDVALAGHYAYVSDWDAGLRVIDVSDPANPSDVGFYDTPGDAFGVAVARNYAYVADWEALRIIDISDPVSPREAGFYETLGQAWDVAVAGSYSYIAAGEEGLRIIDISDPVSPREAGYYETPGIVLNVTVLETYAYVCIGEAGLRIIDISNPTNPSEISFYDTPGSAAGVALAGRYAYVADWERGLRIIDILDPTNPGEVGFYQTRGSPKEVVRVENTMLWIFTSAGVIAALLVHGLSWHTRLRHLSVAVRLGAVGAIGSILYSGIFVLFFFLGKYSSGASAVYVVRYFFIAFWLLALLTVLLIGFLQARSLSAPGWKGVLSAFYEIGLGFLVVAGMNYALQYLIRTPDTGLSDRVYLARFTISFVIGLAALAVIRPIVRLYTPPLPSHQSGLPER